MGELHENRPLAYSYIRMSTDVQLKGHSKQRQLEASASYAQTHGLRLVEDGHLEDLAISAFRGTNVTEGALGRFLGAVKMGAVPKGSYLLVESLDRLSRQQILPSLQLFLDIVRAGINLVTLQDQHVYKGEKTEPSDLFLSLVGFARAHEESEAKSKRVSAAWKNKRSKASAQRQPLTKICPAWLQLKADRTQYEIIKERAAVIRSIFEDTVDGIGSYVITRRLNQKKVVAFGTSQGWQRSYIAKILNNRAVIGEYQPCKIVDGKRVAVGEPIKDYFPPIFNDDDDLFYRAQQARSERRVRGRGRKGRYLTNLFSGLATCAYCHSRMTFENKGPPPKGGTYLVCEAAKRGLDCVRTGWRYMDFEKSFLAFVDQLDLPTLIRNEDSHLKMLDDEIQGLKGRLQAVKADVDKVFALLQTTSLEIVKERLEKLQQQQDEATALLEGKRAERQELRLADDAFYQSKEEIKSLVGKLQAHTSQGQDLYKLRSQVAARTKSLISELQVAPAGTGPFMKSALQQNKELKADPKIVIDASERRYFRVTFRDASTLLVFPNKDDPFDFDARQDWDDAGNQINQSYGVDEF